MCHRGSAKPCCDQSPMQGHCIPSLRDAEVGCRGDAAVHSPSALARFLAEEQPGGWVTQHPGQAALPSRSAGMLLPVIPTAGLFLSAPSKAQWAIASLFLSCAKSSSVDKEQGLPS